MGQSALRWAVLLAASVLLAIASGCGSRPAAHETGRLVYSVSSASGSARAGLFLVDANGTHRTRLTREPPAPASSASWSPVSDKILFAGSEVWTINPDGSAARRIGDGSDAMWSPDGREIATFGRSGHIEIFSSDGSRLRTVDLGVNRDGSVNSPAWSPDLHTLAVVVYYPGESASSSIYLVPADGKGKPRPLTTGPDQVYEENPVWSPDGKMLAFSASAGSNPDGAWTSRPDGSDRRLVATDMRVLAWSRDGTALIGSSFGADTPLYAYPLDGSPRRRLPAAEERRIEAQGRLSPDGAQLITVKKDGALVVSRADGSEPKQLTNPYEEESAGWSPDGTRIAFVRIHGNLEMGEDVDGYVIGIDGKGERPIGKASERFLGTPRWSPNGDALVAESGDQGGPPIELIHPDPLRRKKIAEGTGAAWSPDGTEIAFVGERVAGNRSEGSALYVAGRDGTGRRAIATREGGGAAPVFSYPVWAPDGKSIFIEDYAVSTTRVLQIPVSGAREDTIAHGLSDVFLALLSVSPDGKTVAFTTDKGIETVTVASKERKLLVATPGTALDALAWSPDGKQLGYVSRSSGHEESRLYIVKADGARPRPISRPNEVVTSFDWRPLASD